jgi:hypothetical protein
VHFHYFPKRHSINFILTLVSDIFYHMYNERNTTKTARTRLHNVAGTDWELPEDNALASKYTYIGAINKEQYMKNVNQVCICLFIVHIPLILSVYCHHSSRSYIITTYIILGSFNISCVSHKSNLSFVPKGNTEIRILRHVGGGDRCGMYTL